MMVRLRECECVQELLEGIHDFVVVCLGEIMWLHVCLKLYVKPVCEAVNNSKIQCVCTQARAPAST